MQRLRTLSLLAAFLTAGQNVFAFQLAQDDRETSESQLTAEAIWAFLNDDGFGEATESALLRLSQAYPNSAEAAYWEAKLRFIDSDTTAIWGEFADSLNSLLQEMAQDEAPNVPAVVSLSSALARMEELNVSSGENNSAAKANLAALRCVKLDPSFVAGWALLVESKHRALALMACEQWSKIEPDNAVPLMAKATLALDVLHDEEQNEQIRNENWLYFQKSLSKAALANKCRFPSVNPPNNFSGLIFGEGMEEYAPSLVGQPINAAGLGYLLEARAGMYAWADRSPLASSSWRYLESQIRPQLLELSHSRQAEILQELLQIHCLRTKSGNWGHFIESRPTGLLNRLDRIVSQHEDWDSARELREVRDYLRESVYLLSQESQSVFSTRKNRSPEEELLHIMEHGHTTLDQVAERVSAERPPCPRFLRPRFLNPKPKNLQQALDPRSLKTIQAGTAAATTLLHVCNPDFIRFDVWQDEDFEPIVNERAWIRNAGAETLFEEKRRDDGHVYIEDLSESCIERLQYRSSGLRPMYLREQLKLLDQLNQSRRQYVGPYLVLHGDQSWFKIPELLEHMGYWDEKDSVAIASDNLECLDGLREACQLALFQIIDSDSLREDDSMAKLVENAVARRLNGIAMRLGPEPPKTEQLANWLAAIQSANLELHVIESTSVPTPAELRSFASVVVKADVEPRATAAAD